VGLMRNGCLLAQSPPDDLITSCRLTQHSLTPLHVYGKKKALGDGANEESSLAVGRNEASWASNMKRIILWIHYLSYLIYWRRIASLCWKTLLIFHFLLPANQIIIFCLAVDNNFSGVNDPTVIMHSYDDKFIAVDAAEKEWLL
uniref:Uncharacterized protein n=1 Tax=Amphimedon queenslandica TaxID=400682 RepID=A0A1X7V2W2_AMPQE